LRSCPQVEERLRFYEDGVAPTKNLTAMQDALRTVAETAAAAPVGEDAVDPEEGVDAEARAVAAQPKKGKVRRPPALACWLPNLRCEGHSGESSSTMREARPLVTRERLVSPRRRYSLVTLLAAPSAALALKFGIWTCSDSVFT